MQNNFSAKIYLFSPNPFPEFSQCSDFAKVFQLRLEKNILNFICNFVLQKIFQTKYGNKNKKERR